MDGQKFYSSVDVSASCETCKWSERPAPGECPNGFSFYWFEGCFCGFERDERGQRINEFFGDMVFCPRWEPCDNGCEGADPDQASRARAKLVVARRIVRSLEKLAGERQRGGR